MKEVKLLIFFALLTAHALTLKITLSENSPMENHNKLCICERLIKLLNCLMQEQFLKLEIKKEIEAIFPCLLALFFLSSFL
jgi:hypothetical protein